MTKVLNIIAGVIAAGIGFIILYPILGVTLWISFLVAACLLVVIGMSSTRLTAH